MATKTSKSNESYFARYKTAGVYAANKKRKLQRALKRNPENTSIELALKSIRTTPPRSPAKVRKWPSSVRAAKELELLFTRAKGPVPQWSSKFSMFSIKERATWVI